MAVQRGRNGMMGEEDDEGGLFEEELEFEEEPDSHIPLHLRDIFNAAESGDVDALRQALGLFSVQIFFVRKCLYLTLFEYYRTIITTIIAAMLSYEF